jgi:hypothetical protein
MLTGNELCILCCGDLLEGDCLTSNYVRQSCSLVYVAAPT